MANSKTNNLQGAGMGLLIAIFVIALGVAGFAVHALLQISRKQPAAIGKTNISQPLEAVAQEAQPASEPTDTALPETETRSPSLDMILVGQELQQQQIEALRAIARENTNLSFRLTEEQINLFEKEGRMVQ